MRSKKPVLIVMVAAFSLFAIIFGRGGRDLQVVDGESYDGRSIHCSNL